MYNYVIHKIAATDHARTVPQVSDRGAEVAVLGHGRVKAALAARDLDGAADWLGGVAALEVEEVDGACCCVHMDVCVCVVYIYISMVDGRGPSND